MAKKYNYFDDVDTSKPAKKSNFDIKAKLSSSVEKASADLKEKAEKAKATQKKRAEEKAVEKAEKAQKIEAEKAQKIEAEKAEAQEEKEAYKPSFEEVLDSINVTIDEPEVEEIEAIEPVVDADEDEQAEELDENVEVLAKLGMKNAIEQQKSVTKKQKRRGKFKRFLLRLLGFLSIIAFLVLAVYMTIHFMVQYGNKEQAKQTAFNDAASKICAKYEEDYGICGYQSLEQYGETGYRMTGLCYTRQLDFNSDGNSELLLCYCKGSTYFVEVWAYKGEQFVQAYKNTLMQTNDFKDDIWLTIYTDGGKSYMCEHDKSDLTKVSVLAFDGKQFSEKTTCTFNPDTKQYTIRGSVSDNFDMIKMSGLRQVSATKLADDVQITIDGFTGLKHSDVRTNNRDMMLKAYYNVIDEYIETYGEAKLVEENGLAYVTGVGYVDLIDFNSDGTEELMILYRRAVNMRQEDREEYISVTVDKYFCDIYSFNGVNAWRVYQQEGLSNMKDDADQQYIVLEKSGKKTMLCTNSFDVQNYGRTVNAVSKVLTFDGEKFTQKQKSNYYFDYGYTEYYIDGENTYESNFASRGGYDVPYFDGSNEYDHDKYEVIFIQTNLTRADRVDNLPAQTTVNIQKTNLAYLPTGE